MIEVTPMGLFDRLKSIVLGKKEVSETELRAQQHYKEGMKKTRGNLLKQLQAVFSSYTDVNEELFEELEDIFIMADIGVSTVVEFIDQLKERVRESNVTDPKELQRIMVDKLFEDSDYGLEIDLYKKICYIANINNKSLL